MCRGHFAWRIASSEIPATREAGRHFSVALSALFAFGALFIGGAFGMAGAFLQGPLPTWTLWLFYWSSWGLAQNLALFTLIAATLGLPILRSRSA